MIELRTPVLAGNWKMHRDPDATREFFARFLELHGERSSGTVILFPPALSLEAAKQARGTRGNVHLGVQNVHWEAAGAFTGEISASMAAAAGAEFVLVGHSERRHLFGETDQQVTQKTRAVLAAGLVPVVCVGESLDERRAGNAQQVVGRQLDAVLPAVSDSATFLVAYEPVWAIGTGETATPEDAQSMHAAIRSRLREAVGVAPPILYGGSVKPENAEALLAQPDVDGVLVGGASVDPEGFAAICQAGA